VSILIKRYPDKPGIFIKYRHNVSIFKLIMAITTIYKMTKAGVSPGGLLIIFGTVNNFLCY
jgi:hypothetical protein